jgi:adenylylsulfate kinase
VGPPELEVLDGDELRQFLTRDLTFSREDRDENVHRIAWVARRLARAGLPVVTAAISPYASTRAEVRRLAEEQSIPFLEVHAAAPLEVVAKRDVKGLYARARRGEIPHFTGVSDPYEPPQHPDLVVGLDGESPERSLARIVALLLKENLVITAAAEEERP